MAEENQMDDKLTLLYDEDNNIPEAIAKGLVYPPSLYCVF